MEDHGTCVCNLGNCKKSLKKYRLGWDIHVNPMGEQGWRSGESRVQGRIQEFLKGGVVHYCSNL